MLGSDPIGSLDQAGDDSADSTGTEAAAVDDPTAPDDARTCDGSTASDAPEVDRTIEVQMSEFAYSPSDLTVQAGETVRFVFTNSGAAPHEAILGSMHVQEEQRGRDGRGRHGRRP